MERFSKNDIIALLDDDPKFNLGESTSRDLMLGELLDADVIDRLGRIRLGYRRRNKICGKLGSIL